MSAQPVIQTNEEKHVLSKDRETCLTSLQNTIGRLSGHSFGAKGWAITVTSGFIAAAVSQNKPQLLVGSVLPCLFFWWLDAYYLMLERRFRRKFIALLENPQSKVTAEIFAHETTQDEVGVLKTLFSANLVIFYLTLAVGATAFSFA